MEFLVEKLAAAAAAVAIVDDMTWGGTALGRVAHTVSTVLSTSSLMIAVVFGIVLVPSLLLLLSIAGTTEEE